MRSIRASLVAACVALPLLHAPAKAQVLLGQLFGEKLATPDFNLGFEVGANFSTFEGLDGAERMNAPVFGLFADWRFSEHFHLGSAVLPFAGRGAEGLDPIMTGDAAFDAQTAGGTMKRSLHCVEIPVILKWAPEREQGIRVGAGPSFALVTGATDRYTAVSSAGTHYVLERDIGGDLPWLDFGLSVDAEWRFPLLSIAVRYTHGLTDMGHDGAADAVHSRVLTGTARLSLGKKPSP